MLYPDPVGVYRHDGHTPDHIVAALLDIHERAAVGEVAQQEYVEHAAWLLKKPLQTIEAEFFGSTDRNEEALAYLAGLRPAHKLVLLSNAGPGMIEARFTAEELDRHFDQVVLSYLLKAAKPDPAVFRWTCERLGILPEEVVVIDDTADNCEAAQAIGMKTVQYRDFAQAKSELDTILLEGPVDAAV
jgi:HAD superfamily hydrolase (TIGR01509 family)